MQSVYLQRIMKRNAAKGYEKTKPKQTQLPKGVKLMQSVYLQRIMKRNAAKGYKKTKPKQTQFPQSTNDNKPPLLQAYTDSPSSRREQLLLSEKPRFLLPDIICIYN